MNDRIISSDFFMWNNRSGCVEISDIPNLTFNPFNGLPITVVSARTGAKKRFTLNTSVPGHEDGWDGEACFYVSDDGIKISFFND